MDGLSKKLENLKINKRELLHAECKDMCPQSEFEFRIKQNKMVHSLEKKILPK